MRGGIRSHPLPTLVTIALVASLAACSVGSTGSDFPSPTAIPTLNPNQLELLRRSASPPPAPSRPRDPTPTPRLTPMPTPVDAALEAMLPASLRGIPLQRATMPASIFTPQGDMCLLLCPDEPGRLATAAGLRVEDLTVGFAIPTQTSDLSVGIIAIRFPGDRHVPPRRRPSPRGRPHRRRSTARVRRRHRRPRRLAARQLGHLAAVLPAPSGRVPDRQRRRPVHHRRPAAHERPGPCRTTSRSWCVRSRKARGDRHVQSPS